MKSIAHCCLVLLLLVAVPLSAGERARQRFIARAAAAIHATPMPSEANGAAFMRQVRLNAIPLFAPFGIFGTAGRGVAFQRDSQGHLTNPRLTRIRGIGGTASIGVGFPFSMSVTRNVYALRGNEYNQWATQRHTQASAKVYAGVMVPGMLKIASAGPTVGNPVPGEVVSTRSRHLGVWAATGASMEIKTMRPAKVRRQRRR